MSNYIPISECKIGMIYRVRSRNLRVAVFAGKMNAFIGIRLKFEDEYLFAEYHYDNGPPFGTVKPSEEIGQLPADIEPVIGLGIIDYNTKLPVIFDKTPDKNGNGTQYLSEEQTVIVKGWCYQNSGEIVQGKLDIVSIDNEKLFDYLKEIESKIVFD